MRKQMKTMCLTGFCLTVLLLSTASAQSPDRPERTPSTRPADSGKLPARGSRELPLPTGPNQPTRLELAVLDLTCPTGIAAGIDLNRIATPDASPAVILDRLRQYGQASAIFRSDSVINLVAGATIRQGCRSPVLMDATYTSKGVAVPHRRYTMARADLTIRGQWRQDNAPLADVVCETDSWITDSPIRNQLGEGLQAYVTFRDEQTFQIRQGRPTCWIISGGPNMEKKEPTSHLFIYCLTLTHVGEPAAAAATPQTMVVSTIYEIEGDKDKLGQIDLGKDPPSDPAKLQELLGRFGKVQEIARPSHLAIWPCKSTINIDVHPYVYSPAVATRPELQKQAADIRPFQIEFTIDGRWSDANPQQGKVTFGIVKRRQDEQNREMEVKDSITSTANIENGKPMCILGDVMAAEGQDKASRYVICLTARLIEEKKGAAAQAR